MTTRSHRSTLPGILALFAALALLATLSVSGPNFEPSLAGQGPATIEATLADAPVPVPTPAPHPGGPTDQQLGWTAWSG